MPDAAEPSSAPEGHVARPHRRRWWVLFALFGILFSAWAVSSPPVAGPDEGAHMVRAASAARGQLSGPIVKQAIDQMKLKVPEGYGDLRDAACWGPRSPFLFEKAKKNDGTPNCVPSMRGGQHLITEITYEFRGLPLTYFLTGLPTLAFPDVDGMFLMRVLQALVCAAFMASALASALGRRRPRLPVFGVIVAASPELWYLTSVVNPNALEIVAAIALWSTVVALARNDSTEPDGRLVLRAGVILTALVAIRPLSPGFAILALGSFVVIGWRARALEIWQRRDVRGWLIAAGVMTLINAVWVLGVAFQYPGHSHGVGLGKAIGGVPHVFRQTIGILGSDYINLPVPVYVIWIVAAIGAFAVGLVTSERRNALVGIALAVITLILSFSVNGLNIPPVSFIWQGRYGLPVAAGAVIVLCGCAQERRLPNARWRSAPAIAVTVLLATQLIVFVGYGRRLGMGHPDGLNPFDYLLHPLWEPILPPTLLLIAFAGAIVALAITLWRATETPARAALDEREQVSTPPALA